MEEKYGIIVKSVITEYRKFHFTIEVLTSKDFKLRLYTGGDPDSIYRYDPLGDWDDHEDAELHSVTELEA